MQAEQLGAAPKKPWLKITVRGCTGSHILEDQGWTASGRPRKAKVTEGWGWFVFDKASDPECYRPLAGPFPTSREAHAALQRVERELATPELTGIPFGAPDQIGVLFWISATARWYGMAQTFGRREDAEGLRGFLRDCGRPATIARLGDLHSHGMPKGPSQPEALHSLGVGS